MSSKMMSASDPLASHFVVQMPLPEQVVRVQPSTYCYQIKKRLTFLPNFATCGLLEWAEKQGFVTLWQAPLFRISDCSLSRSVWTRLGEYNRLKVSQLMSTTQRGCNYCFWQSSELA